MDSIKVTALPHLTYAELWNAFLGDVSFDDDLDDPIDDVIIFEVE